MTIKEGQTVDLQAIVDEMVADLAAYRDETPVEDIFAPYERTPRHGATCLLDLRSLESRLLSGCSRLQAALRTE